MSRKAPLADALSGREKIVVLAPHPDDETLGCGGLLARAFAGAGAHVVCVTDGSASHPASREWPPVRLAEMRRGELIEAIEILGGGAADLTWLGHPDSRLHEVSAADILPPLTAAIDGQAAPAKTSIAIIRQPHNWPRRCGRSAPICISTATQSGAVLTIQTSQRTPQATLPSPSTPPPTARPKPPRSARIAASLGRSCKTTPKALSCPMR